MMIKEGSMNTLVVNCYAGPGAGKTTCAWEVASQLKKEGINTEYVPEYPKELVWEGKFDLLANQEHIFEEQARRLERLRGKVEVVVTDSPILMNHVYGENNSKAFTDAIDAEYKKYFNFNLFVQRGEGFQQEGRVQNLEESIQLDRKIKKMLREKNIFFGVYKHENVKYIADNVIRNLTKIRNLPDIDVKPLATLPDAAMYDSLYGKEVAAGYHITDTISYNNETYVLGYNPDAPEPYVTWWKDNDGFYKQGEYFADKVSAVQNLVDRSITISISEKKWSEFEKMVAIEGFDKQAFIDGIEVALDYGGDGVSKEEYMLYQRILNERALNDAVDEAVAESVGEEFEM